MRAYLYWCRPSRPLGTNGGLGREARIKNLGVGLIALTTVAAAGLLLRWRRVVATGPPREVLDAELLSEVYGQAIQVIDHPTRDCPLVIVS